MNIRHMYDVKFLILLICFLLIISVSTSESAYDSILLNKSDNISYQDNNNSTIPNLFYTYNSSIFHTKERMNNSSFINDTLPDLEKNLLISHSNLFLSSNKSISDRSNFTDEFVNFPTEHNNNTSSFYQINTYPKKYTAEIFNYKFLIIGIILCILLSGLIFYYYFLQKKRKPKNSEIYKNLNKDYNNIQELSSSIKNQYISQSYDNEKTNNFKSFPKNNLKIIGAAFIGPSHLKSNIPCQDAYKFSKYQDKYGLIAVSDGLGSAVKSDIGSDIAVTEVINFLNLHIDNLNTPESAQIIIKEAMIFAREKIFQLSKNNNEESSLYACTLIVAVCTEEYVCTGHIGDGAVVTWKHNSFQILSSPENIEYVNQVVPLTSQIWERHLRISQCIDELNGVAVFSDGCQRASLTKKDGKYYPFIPFFSPLFNYVNDNDEEISQNELISLLKSDLLKQNSDDDKTMVICIIK